MDNRDFQFLCVNTKSLWQDGVVERGDLDISDKGIALKQEKTYTYEKAYKQIEGLIDFGLDQCGVIYGLDVDGRIICFDPCTGHGEYIERVKFADPKAIAISSSSIFIVHGEGTESTARVSTLARVNYQVRWESVINDTDIEKIKDIAVDSRENLYILGACTIHRFNVCGKSPEFGHEWSAFVDGLVEPVSIAADKSDTVYVLDKSKEPLKKFSTTGDGKPQKFRLPISTRLARSGLAVLDKTAYVGVGTYIGEHKVLYGFDISQEKDDYSGKREGYAGKCDAIRVGLRGDIHILDRRASEIALLKLEERFVSTEVTYVSKLLDSNENGCQWHKFILKREIPDNSRITVSYHISDYKHASPVWFEAPPNPKDALILSPKGRYIKFKLNLSSTDGLDTPRVKSLKAFFPRQSYLRYLPAVYQEDQISQDFLERFLSLFETFFWKLEQRTEGISRYLDVDSTPKEFLRWLSYWLGISTDENWPVEKRRTLLERAPELLKKRGTREGLKELIGTYLRNPIFVEPLKKWIKDPNDETSKECLEDFERLCREAADPIIVEHFQLRRSKESGLALPKPGVYKEYYRVCVPGELGDILIESKVEVITGDNAGSWEQACNEVSTVKIEEKQTAEQRFEQVKLVDAGSLSILRTAPLSVKPSSIMWVGVELNVKEPLRQVWITDTLTKNGRCAACRCLLFIQPWARLFGDCPYRFCVLLKPFSVKHEAELNTVRRIVEQEKPAHTRGGVVLLQPWLYLDMHTYLGVNTILSKPRFVLGRDSVISRDTVIASTEESGQIDLRARVGMDTVLT